SEVLCSGGAQGSLPPAGLPPGCVASVILGCPPWSIVRPCYGAARRGPPGGHRRPAATAYDDRESPISRSPAPRRPSRTGTPSPGGGPLDRAPRRAARATRSEGLHRGTAQGGTARAPRRLRLPADRLGTGRPAPGLQGPHRPPGPGRVLHLHRL